VELSQLEIDVLRNLLQRIDNEHKSMTKPPVVKKSRKEQIREKYRIEAMEMSKTLGPSFLKFVDIDKL
jgi:predicted transcriptional regulator